MSDEVLVFDIEANGFLDTVTQIWCVVILNYETGSIRSYVGKEILAAIVRLYRARAIIGHWISRYDIPVIEKLFEIQFDDEGPEIIDTVDLSRSLAPWMPNHKLRTWGDLLDYPKGEWKDFSRFDPRMVPYCCQDVFLNREVFDVLVEDLKGAA